MTYSYTSRNQLSSVVETAGTTTYSYDANGNETGITNPNSTTVTRVYDAENQLTSVTNKNSSNTTLSSFTYAYNDDGLRTSCTEAGGDVVSYGYDAAHRLTSESRTGTNAYSKTYTLDGVGNRTAQTVGGTSTTFTYSNDDELTATSGGFTNSYSYNANGEQTGRTLSGTAYTLSYDYDGQLTQIVQGSSTTSFAYDATGRRYSRTSGGTTTTFQYAGGKVLLEKQGTTTTGTYTYGNALIRKDGEVPMFDGQGSERTVTDSTQAVTGTISYDAFGQTIATTGSSTSPYMYAAQGDVRSEGDAGLLFTLGGPYDGQAGGVIAPGSGTGGRLVLDPVTPPSTPPSVNIGILPEPIPVGGRLDPLPDWPGWTNPIFGPGMGDRLGIVDGPGRGETHPGIGIGKPGGGQGGGSGGGRIGLPGGGSIKIDPDLRYDPGKWRVTIGGAKVTATLRF